MFSFSPILNEAFLICLGLIEAVALYPNQRWSRCRSGLRKQSTIFAEAWGGPGVGFL